MTSLRLDTAPMYRDFNREPSSWKLATRPIHTLNFAPTSIPHSVSPPSPFSGMR